MLRRHITKENPLLCWQSWENKITTVVKYWKYLRFICLLFLWLFYCIWIKVWRVNSMNSVVYCHGTYCLHFRPPTFYFRLWKVFCCSPDRLWPPLTTLFWQWSALHLCRFTPFLVKDSMMAGTESRPGSCGEEYCSAGNRTQAVHFFTRPIPTQLSRLSVMCIKL
jgi:hypothetical protein